MAEVILENVCKSFDGDDAVKNLSMTIADGEFVVFLGPTGAGKTTTLRLIAGLEKADSGDILIDGYSMLDAAPAERDTAFVFQQYSLYPHLSVFDNLAFPLRSPARKFSKEAVEARVLEVAKMVRIDHKLKNKSTQLSGGEMQRVAIGRALVREPKIFLMDEPLSSLDAKLRSDLRLELKRIQNEIGATMLYVTHDQIEAMTMADRIGILAKGELVQLGTPREVYENPANLHVAARLGQPHINLISPGLIEGMDVPSNVKTIGARTEHLNITLQNGGGGNARIDWVEHLGDQNHLHLLCGDKKLISLADPNAPFDAGDEIKIELKNPLLFDGDGERVRL
ncbi:MAG: ABC transporter ATP-binding protein [Rhizobiales bacterium]|nr:ABC transporter ATP-binding protein [Hyphomicrobiales bacterium]